LSNSLRYLLVECWPRSSGEIINMTHDSSSVQKFNQFRRCALTNRIFMDFAIDTRFFFRRSIESGESISNVGISNEAQTLRHRRQLMECSGKSRPAVEPMHLAFPRVWPEFSSHIWNQGSSWSSCIFHLFAAPSKLTHSIVHLRVT
jgi:hypothetical protein